METCGTKRFIPKGFELATTLSQPIWSMYRQIKLSSVRVKSTRCHSQEGPERAHKIIVTFCVNWSNLLSC